MLWTPCVYGEDHRSAFTRAVEYYQDRKLEEAFVQAKLAVRQSPNHADSHFLLGELYYLRQEMAEAEKSWVKALKLSPEREDIQQRLEKLRREQKIENDLARSDTWPFLVRFAREQNPMDVGELRQSLRDAYRLIGQQMGYFPSHPITVLLYSEREFQAIKGVSHQVGGLYDGKIRLPLCSGDGADIELKRVLWHEYTHAVIHDLTKGNCPLWLNEGVATLQESRVNPPNLSLAQAAYQQGKMPAWGPLWDQPYDSASLALNYQVSYLIARYLVERWRWGEMIRLLGRLEKGEAIGEALRAQYREDPAAIEKAWHRWLQRHL
ncbi:MAG: hypothetical protein HYZ94_03105 [Candidatus Omnitrophica bacterium]|nr:hypothetical protein [Candidatus Omnitrophota bacterium]